MKDLFIKHKKSFAIGLSLLSVAFVLLVNIEISIVLAAAALLLLMLYGLFTSYRTGAIRPADDFGWFNDIKQIDRLFSVGRIAIVNSFFVLPTLTLIVATFSKAIWLSFFL
ncbi:MAG: hypothetical protein ABI644_11050 [Arenimonas sp.]